MSFATAVRAGLAGLLALCAAWSAPADARDKTDVVRLANGDRITGEILAVEYGRLQVKTDSMGTVSIEWPDVVAIDSRHAFLVERIGGLQSYGGLRTGADGRLTVDEGGEPIVLAEIVRIGQVEGSVWDGLQGSVSVGATYAKSSAVNVSSARFDVASRGMRWNWALEGSWDRTSARDSDTSDRLRVAYTQQFIRPRARYWIGLGSFERNEELGIEGRLQAGGAYGWRFHEAADSVAALYAGAVVNQEWVTGTEDSRANVEGVVGAQWRVYRFAAPEVSLTSGLAAYPSLTDSGRVRARADVSLRREFADDFTLQLSFYNDYDNRPPGDRSVTNDYGFATSLGYSF